jgi:hypothetical protein
MCKKCGFIGTKIIPFNLFTGLCLWCYELDLRKLETK